MRRSGLPGLVLLVGAAVVVVEGRANRHIEDSVALLGLSLLAAWAVSSPRPAGRFVASGCVLAGVGTSLVVVRELAQSDYRDPILFTGIALGFVALEELRAGQIRRGAGALVSVAIAEAILTWGPSRVDAPDIWRALQDGWGYGLILGVYAVMVLAGATLPGRSVGRAAAARR